MTKPLRLITALLILAVSFHYAHASAISYVAPHIYTVGSPARAATVLSSNASLSGLKLKPVSTLTSVTGPGSGNYTTTVPYSQTSVKVVATAAEAHATIKVNGTAAASGAASQPIPLSIGDNVINIVVTAQDGVTVKNFIITATRAVAAFTLSNLTLSTGALSPMFAAATTSYTATVANAISSIKITPTATDANATVKVNDVTVASGTASANIPLAVGANAITTVVTSSDGTNTKTYTVTVTRIPPDISADATLSGIQLNPTTTLTAAGGPGSTNYTASVPNSQTSLTVTATASESHATIKINGTTVASGSASPSIALTVGTSVAVTIVVTAQDGVTTKTYTVTVTRPSTNAGLSGLKLNPVSTLTSVTGPGDGNYTAKVPNGQASVQVNATTSEAHATIKVNGTTAASGAASQPVPLNLGDNVINIAVTAQDGATVKNYIITVTRTAVTLSNLTLSAGVLSPGFIATTTSYTATVPNATSSIKITPTVTDANSTVKVNGATVASGTASASISLAEGFNAITTVVTSGDGTSSQSYTTNVTRVAANLSADASLAGLQLNPNATLTAAGPGSTNYTASVPNSQASFTVTATASQTQATIKINGTTVASGSASPSIALPVGPSVAATIVVTAQDGVTTKTYTVTVTRPSNNASLSGIKLNPVSTLTSVSGPGSGNYTTAVINGQTSVKVNATTSEAHATIKVNGTAVASGAASQAIPLSTGDNVINVVVTAQDGATVKNYIITVTRAAPSATLSNLGLYTGYTGVLSPVFATATTSYTSKVPYSISSINIIPTVTDADATIKVNGVTVPSGYFSQNIPLAEGANAINTVVTSSDGAKTQTYTVTVTRAAAGLSTDATLAGIQLNPNVPLTTEDVVVGGPNSFNTHLSATMPNSQASFTITPTASEAHAAIKINGTAIASGSASSPFALAVGDNVNVIDVIAQDGVTTRTYTVTVTRAAADLSTNANLSGIGVNPVFPLKSVAGPGNGNYTTTVPNSQTYLRVSATPSEVHATIKVNGTALAPGNTSEIGLNVGDNVINVVVTAQDGATMKNYIITVTRAAPSMVAQYDGAAADNLKADGIFVHQGVSPNGDGDNDVLTVDGLTAYPDNSIAIMSRSGAMVFEAKGYNNTSVAFDGHSNKNGRLQQAGTYFYSLDYKDGDKMKRKTGFILLKY